MDKIKELWINKNDPKGRIDITVFFINIFLLLSHIFLMIIYILVNNKFMMCINVISLILYASSIFWCYKKSLRYAGIVFLEIWFHMICAIMSFGWEPCFQNWSFAIISAYFLPTFGYNEKKASYKSTIYYTSFVILTFVIMYILVNVVNVPISQHLTETMTHMFFVLNNLITFFTIIMISIFYTSNNRRKQRELTRKADFDELTNLYNRYSINQLGKQIINEAKEKEKSYSVAILDIDLFKQVNDTYGHTSGDMVLVGLSDILRFFSIKGLVFGRWGGEEFVIIAPSSLEYSEFVKMLDRLRIKISRSKFKIENEKEINLTVSIGVAKIKEYKSLEKAVSLADTNLYKAKTTGRNKVVS